MAIQRSLRDGLPDSFDNKQSLFVSAGICSGELVEVYSSNWLKRAYREHLSNRKYKTLTAFMNAHGSTVTGTFWILALDDYQDETKLSLIRAFKPLKGIVSARGDASISSGHNPDFLIFNSATQQILAFGLGRRNREFLFAVDHKGEPVDKLFSVRDFLEKKTAFKNRFTARDIAGTVEFLLRRFVVLAEGWEEYGRLPISAEEARRLLEKGSDGGVYRSDYGEEYSRKELFDFCKREKHAISLIKRGESPFRSLFKGCDRLSWELNTGDL